LRTDMVMLLLPGPFYAAACKKVGKGVYHVRCVAFEGLCLLILRKYKTPVIIKL
jgi:hypothetical protein